jgi:hypothetical protein
MRPYPAFLCDFVASGGERFCGDLESLIRVKQMATLHGNGGFTMMSECMAAEGVF